MGATAPMALSSKVQYDGAMNLAHNIAKTTFSSTAAVDNVSSGVAHGPVQIQRVILAILTSTTTSANIVMGNTTTASAYFGPINLKNQAAGLYELLASNLTAGTVGLKLDKGNFFKFKANQSASGSPVFSGCVIFVPQSGASDATTTG